MISLKHMQGVIHGLDRRQVMLSATLCGLAVLAAAFALTPAKSIKMAAQLKAVLAAPRAASISPPATVSAAPGPRRVYPFSIVPGGVANHAELARVVNSDSLVAEHYANFNVDAARIVTVTQPRAVYVSYRKGDKIFWTAKKLMLTPGETLLTDGVNEVRTRCGNRISDLPQSPVAGDEPSAAVFDSVVESDGSALQMIDAGNLLEFAAAGPGQGLTTFSNTGLSPATQALLTDRGLANRFGANSFGTGGFGGSGISAAPGHPRTTPPAQSGFSNESNPGGANGNTNAGGGGGGGGPGGGGDPGTPTDPKPPTFVGGGDPGGDPGPIKPKPTDLDPPFSPNPPLVSQSLQVNQEEEGKVPEPATLALMLGSLLVLAVARRRPRLDRQASHKR